MRPTPYLWADPSIGLKQGKYILEREEFVMIGKAHSPKNNQIPKEPLPRQIHQWG